jgi:hypothetical protein
MRRDHEGVRVEVDQIDGGEQGIEPIAKRKRNRGDRVFPQEAAGDEVHRDATRTDRNGLQEQERDRRGKEREKGKNQEKDDLCVPPPHAAVFLAAAPGHLHESAVKRPVKGLEHVSHVKVVVERTVLLYGKNRKYDAVDREQDDCRCVRLVK